MAHIRITSKAVPMSQIVAKIDFFAQLPPAVSQTVESKLRLRVFNAEERIVEEAGQDSDVFFVLSGSVRIGQYTADGHELIYDICATGDMFGEFAAVENIPRTANAHALEPVEVAVMAAADFRQLLHDYPDIGLRLNQRLIRIVRKLNQRLKRRLGDSALVRVYGYIAEEAEQRKDNRGGQGVIHLPKQAILASLLDVSRETVARALGVLAQEEIIRKEPGGFILLDPAKLAGLLGEG